MNVNFIISMYNEHSVVLHNLKLIKEHNPDATVVVIHSEDGPQNDLMAEIISLANYYKMMPNLAKIYDRMQVPALSLQRNFSIATASLLELAPESDFVVYLTGDTKIKSVQNIIDHCQKMADNNRDASVAKAIGQLFHGQDGNGDILHEQRLQTPYIMDFMPQYFILSKRVAEYFKDIKMTNKFTSEQCLGDTLAFACAELNINSFLVTHIINGTDPRNAYAYNDCVSYHER